jgi:branched-chain amino acid transport system ATP-binding protein
LIRKPEIILLDEPFEGLAPVIVQNLTGICERIAAEGQTIVVVEQNVYAALKFSHRAYILNNGHVVFEGTPDELKGKPEILRQYLGV